MNEEARKKRNAAMLELCNPVFRVGVRHLLDHLESWGLRPRINEGDSWRSLEAEARAQASGNSGVTWGMHNAMTIDGRPDALAVDLTDDDSPLAPRAVFLHRVNEAVGSLGLMTGILWGHPKGRRLTQEEKDLIIAACKTGDWSHVERIGFDPLHIQPAGLSLSDARAGKRP